MTRAIIGAVVGFVVGTAAALPLWAAFSAAEVAELRRQFPPDLELNYAARLSLLLYLALPMASGGAAVGCVLGATSAVLRELQRVSWQSDDPRGRDLLR